MFQCESHFAAQDQSALREPTRAGITVTSATEEVSQL